MSSELLSKSKNEKNRHRRGGEVACYRNYCHFVRQVAAEKIN